MNLKPRGRKLRRAGLAAIFSAVLTVTGFASVVVAAEPLAPAVVAEPLRSAVAAEIVDGTPAAGSTPSGAATVSSGAVEPVPSARTHDPVAARTGTPPETPVVTGTRPAPGAAAEPGIGTGTAVEAAPVAIGGAASAVASPETAPQAPGTAGSCTPESQAAPAGDPGYGCGEAGAYNHEASTQPVSSISGEVRMAVVGDSISSGSTQRLETIAQADAGTWVSTAIQNDRVAYAGGWAQWGSTSTEQAKAVYPVVCDLLVMLTGTNDIRSNIDFDQQMLDMNHIANVIGAPRVLVVALPPNDAFANEALVRDRNVRLELYAASRGWDFTDPWAGFRTGERWATGANLDGYHPTDATHAVVGQRIGDYIAGHYGPTAAL
jgi:hypothetical protein